MSKPKVIIIGGGLGGLMSGALLSKEGFQVSLLEKQHNIGGGLQSYRRGGVVFDTGMHILGGMSSGGNIFKICQYLGISDDFVCMDIDSKSGVLLYVDSEKKSYLLDMSREGFVDSLSTYFPSEKEHLSQYLSSIYSIIDELDLFHLRKPTHSFFEHSDNYDIAANQLLDKFFDDERLKSVIACINTLYAGEENITPSYLHAAISMVFMNVASRIAGGYSNFAKALVSVIEQNGGVVKTGTEVVEIKTTERKFCGVKLANQEEIAADYCISAIPPSEMISLVDNPRLFSKAYRNLIEQRNDSLSAFVVNIKLKENRLRYFNSIGFYYKDYDSAWTASDGQTIDKFMYMTPPTESQGEWAATLSITALMKWSAVEAWESTICGRRNESYYAWKEQLCNNLIEQMNHVIPGFSNMVESIDAASPLTIRDYTSVRHGAMCGNRNESGNLFGSLLPVKTKIENLLLTGQSNHMHGFCGVSLTAIETVEAIVGEGVVIDKINQFVR